MSEEMWYTHADMETMKRLSSFNGTHYPKDDFDRLADYMKYYIDTLVSRVVGIKIAPADVMSFEQFKITYR